MLPFRFLSPFGWFVALLLFFLPWIDFRCKPDEAPTTFSGAQLAWGGSTSYSHDGPTQWTLVDVSRLTNEREYSVAACLLNAYLIGLIVGIGFILRLPPGQRRALWGGAIAGYLLLLLLSAGTLLLENPFKPGIAALQCLPWYYGSYAANLASLLTFVVEYSRYRKRREAAERAHVGSASA